MNFEKASVDTSMDTGSENRSSQTNKQEQKRIIKEVTVIFTSLKGISFNLGYTFGIKLTKRWYQAVQHKVYI